MNMRSMKRLAVACGCAAALSACRGQESADPPVHLNPNMDTMPRYDAQSESKFFSDRRTMRTPVEGTIARGQLYEGAYGTGRESEDRYAMTMPVKLDAALLARGQERYGIYCVPCHDSTGYGNGLVVQRGYPKPTNFHEKYARTMTDGQMFESISKGARNMPGYGPQIPVADRWAIVAYVRALQFSQNATINDVPAEKRGSLPVEAPQP